MRLLSKADIAGMVCSFIVELDRSDLPENKNGACNHPDCMPRLTTFPSEEKALLLLRVVPAACHQQDKSQQS